MKRFVRMSVLIVILGFIFKDQFIISITPLIFMSLLAVIARHTIKKFEK